ncbi:C-terminal binding protein [Candidatus Poribacteria bacterium]|nr:C-terminal binding protein [Candidatus Poribacteria bacterium]
MAEFKVAVTDYVFPDLDSERATLAENNAELVIAQCESVDDVISIARDADVILNTYFRPLNSQTFSELTKCKAVIRYGIGVDSIDIESATQHGIMVANVPDYCCEEVSDHTVASMLSLLRKLPLSDKRIRQGEWSLSYLKPMSRIREMTVGIIGMGRIGRLSAMKLSVFGVKIVFADPNVSEEDVKDENLNLKKVSLDELAKVSDAILLHAPANPKTYHLLNSEYFKKMQRRPIIVNCARGSLIDTEALIEALSNEQISGAALDVIEGVPPFDPNNRLAEFENVIFSPHSAWYSEDALVDLRKLALDEVLRVLKGQKPKSLLNPGVLSNNN